jgi:hypothetical protein
MVTSLIADYRIAGVLFGYLANYWSSCHNSDWAYDMIFSPNHELKCQTNFVSVVIMFVSKSHGVY